MAKALLVFLSTWFAGTLHYSYSGKFERYSSAALLGAGLAAPPAAYLCFYAISREFRAVIQSLSPRQLTLLEAPRMLGGSFLLFKYSQGLLPGGFAWPTGISDISVGISAFPAAYFLISSRDKPKSGFILWHRVGLACLVISSLSGILTSRTRAGILREGRSSQALSSFPMSMVPVFLGPMMILLHIMALDIAAHETELSEFRRPERPGVAG